MRGAYAGAAGHAGLPSLASPANFADGNVEPVSFLADGFLYGHDIHVSPLKWATAGCVVTNPYLPQIPAHGTTLRKAFQVSRRPSGHRLRLCGRLCLCARSCGMACCTRGPARPPGGTGCSGHPFLAGHRPGCDDRLSPTSTTNRVVADAPIKDRCCIPGR